MRRLIEWVPGRHWLVEVTEHGFVPESEVKLQPGRVRVPRWVVGGKADTQGWEVIRDTETGVEVRTTDGRTMAIVLLRMA